MERAIENQQQLLGLVRERAFPGVRRGKHVMCRKTLEEVAADRGGRSTLRYSFLLATYYAGTSFTSRSAMC